MSNKHKKNLQKLELTWIGKGDEPKLEPRILIEQPEYSYGDSDTENMLIHGDNLLALKALEQELAGKVKCICIDPPYNTGSAFEHYDDGLEHSIWLNLMRQRLNILKTLLSKDGSIWISIDYNECHYLKVMCDEIFGRKNFIAEIIWQKRSSRENRAAIGSAHDNILVYAKMEASKWKQYRNLLPPNSNSLSNPDNDSRGLWASVPFTAQGFRKNQMYKIITPTGKELDPPKGRCWGATEEVYKQYLKEERVYFPNKGNGRPRIKQFENERKGLVPMSLWLASEVGTTEESKKEILNLFPDIEPFGTPKPERLIKQIISISTSPGEIVLDSFLGSGTTASVSHKLGRKYIGIELGEHAYSHCFPRLRKVVDGEQGGISQLVDWSGGGGFKFYNLASSLLKKDKYGNWIIAEHYNADMLAAAMSKQEGFRYQPDTHVYWKQGQSTEKDFIYTTTQFITVETLDQIHEEMQLDQSLLICCKAFQKECKAKYGNITIKKIPHMLLGRCEFGKEDYSLNIIDMPEELEVEKIALVEEEDTRSIQEINRAEQEENGQQSLF